MSIGIFENGPGLEARLRQALPGIHLEVHGHPLDPDRALESTGYRIVTITPNSRIEEAVLERLPGLELIVTTSTGFDHIDLEACQKRGVRVANVPSWAEPAVAEWVFTLLLGYLRKLRVVEERTRSNNFGLEGLGGGELFGKTLGIVGLGRIGQRVAAIGRGFGMKVLAHNVREDRDLARALGLTYAGLDDLLGRSDVVSLHAPLTPETKGLMDPERIGMLKPGAILVNVARGELVDSAALLAGLESGRIGGALLDVVAGLDTVGLPGQETQTLDRTLKALLKREDVIISPHLAWYTEEAVDRVFEVAVENIRGFLDGGPRNIVS